MKLTKFEDGYELWLSADDTERWARNPKSKWPISRLAGKRLYVEVGKNGIDFCAVNDSIPKNLDGEELDAIVADHLPPDLRRFWPVWEKQTA